MAKKKSQIKCFQFILHTDTWTWNAWSASYNIRCLSTQVFEYNCNRVAAKSMHITCMRRQRKIITQIVQCEEFYARKCDCTVSIEWNARSLSTEIKYFNLFERNVDVINENLWTYVHIWIISVGLNALCATLIRLRHTNAPPNHFNRIKFILNQNNVWSLLSSLDQSKQVWSKILCSEHLNVARKAYCDYVGRKKDRIWNLRNRQRITTTQEKTDPLNFLNIKFFLHKIVIFFSQ